MKDRLLNLLMLLTVGLALGLTWLREPAPSASLTLPAAAVTPRPSPTLHPAESYQMRRAETRRQERASLLSLLESPAASQEAKAAAEEQLLSLARQEEIELAAEAALLGKGYDHALAVAREGSLTLLLRQELTGPQAELILALAQEASGLEREQIRITGY